MTLRSSASTHCVRLSTTATDTSLSQTSVTATSLNGAFAVQLTLEWFAKSTAGTSTAMTTCMRSPRSWRVHASVSSFSCVTLFPY